MKRITNEEAIKECVKIQAFGVSERQVAAMEVAIQAIKRESSIEQSAKWVAAEIFDDNWEYNKDAFDELANVGDEIILNTNAIHKNKKAIVLACDGSDYPYNVLIDDGNTEWVREDAIECKIGHSDQIAEILKQMKEKNQ